MGSERLEKLCLPPPPPGGAPWLVYIHEDGEEKMQTFSTIWPKNNKTYLKAIPELQGKYVQVSCFGWLLLQDKLYFQDFCLWNPVTLQTISLPSLESLRHIDVRITTCALTSSPDNDDDFTVFVFCKHIAFSCHPICGHEPRWRVHKIEIEGRRASVTDAIACNGLIYAWASTKDANNEYKELLITVKASTSTSSSSISLTSLQEKPHFIDPKCIGTSDYMLESCGQVYYVCFTASSHPRTNAVEIWELDLDKRNWVEVKSLNNRAFFLGDDCCTWCWATTDSRVEGNSVFVPRNFDNTVDNTLYKYSLQDRSFTVYLPCPNVVSRRRQPFWFIPQGSHPRSLARQPLQKASIDEEVDIHILNQNADIGEYSEKLLPKQNETTGNMLDRLPLDVIALISKYLYCFDYLDFRTTCKTVRSILPHARCQWRRTYDSSLPFFVSLPNNDGWLKVMDSFRNESCYITIPKSPKGPFSIEYCKDGWLILYSGGESFHFFNLFTRVWGDFPPDEDAIRHFMSIGFSTCPCSSDCVIVGMSKFELLTIWYVRSKDQDWDFAEFDCGEEGFSPSTCPPVYRNGCFYFLDRKGCVGVFELVGDVATWEVYGRPKTRDTIFHSYHLVECDGQLFSVFIGKLGKWIQVFRFDDFKKGWVRVKSLGNHVFFISRPSSISTVAREVGMGNRIYLPRLHDNRFIFYSLETHKYHVVGTHVSMDCFWPSEEPLECCWA